MTDPQDAQDRQQPSLGSMHLPQNVVEGQHTGRWLAATAETSDYVLRSNSSWVDSEEAAEAEGWPPYGADSRRSALLHAEGAVAIWVLAALLVGLCANIVVGGESGSMWPWSWVGPARVWSHHGCWQASQSGGSSGTQRNASRSW